MVAHKAHHAPACLGCFLLQCHEQVQHLAWFRAAIQKISDLNQGGFAPCPMVGCVYKAFVLEYGDEIVEITVHIADGDNAFREIRSRSGWSYARQRK